MPTFSERQGLRPRRTVVQVDSLDDRARLAIWNNIVILKDLLDGSRMRAASSFHDVRKVLLPDIWVNYLGRARDEIPQDHRIWSEVKSVLLDGAWFEVFDFTEWLLEELTEQTTGHFAELAELLATSINRSLEGNLVGFRIIGAHVTPLDSAVEIAAVEEAMSLSSVVAGAHHSLDRALALYSDREAPDYANSIKESISAVEAVVRFVTGETTLGAGLSRLEIAGFTLHPALKSSWSKMYGWTSDESGIRHGHIDAADADAPLAKYVLVTCAAFMSYFIEKGTAFDLFS